MAALLALVAVCLGSLMSTNVAVDQTWNENREILVRNAMHVAQDDGFYYLEIAKNVATGAGSTFDEVHPTNGYHPLWMLSLVPIFWVTTNPESALLAAVALQSLLFLLSCLVLARTLRLDHSWPVVVVATLAWVRAQASHWMIFFGLEYALQTFLVCLAGYYYLRDFYPERPVSSRPFLRLGAVLALCFLARLETAILALFLVASIAFMSVERKRNRELLLLVAPLLVATSSYALINIWLFGHPLPVSGAVKAARSEFLLGADMIVSSQGYLGVKLDQLWRSLSTFNASFRLPLLFGLFAPLALLAVPKTVRSPLSTGPSCAEPRSWLPFVAYAWVHLALVTLVFHGGESYKPWYFVVPLWLAVVAGATVAKRLLPAPAGAFERGRSLIIGLVALVLLASLATNLGRWRHAFQRPLARATLLQEAAWIRENLPPLALAGSWNAGIVGYFSERNVVNLDGLVNSWRYFEEGRFDLCRYWRETGIEFLVDMFPIDAELTYLNDQYARWSDIRPCRDRLVIAWRGASAGDWYPTAIRVLPPEVDPRSIAHANRVSAPAGTGSWRADRRAGSPIRRTTIPET